MIYKIILLCLFTLSLGMRIAYHGKKDDKPENGWRAFIAFLIIIWLLYMSGFFNTKT